MGPFGSLLVVTACCISSALPPAPAEDARSPKTVITSLQGSWTLDSKQSVMLADDTISEFLPGYRSALASIQIDERKMTLVGTKALINLDDAHTRKEQIPTAIMIRS